MKRVILQIGNPILEKKSQKVTNIKEQHVQDLIDDLLDTCKSKDEVTAGLSAPQIGENLCVIVCRRMDIEEATNSSLSPDKAWEVMINPEITKFGKKESSYWEGCLSVGEGANGLYAPVSRLDNVDLRYQNRQGKVIDLPCKGFFAHIVQHEIDHLNGRLFLSYVQDPETIWKSKDLDAYYQENGEYPSF
jgi:peptide deformylase